MDPWLWWRQRETHQWQLSNKEELYKCPNPKQPIRTSDLRVKSANKKLTSKYSPSHNISQRSQESRVKYFRTASDIKLSLFEQSSPWLEQHFSGSSGFLGLRNVPGLVYENYLVIVNSFRLIGPLMRGQPSAFCRNAKDGPYKFLLKMELKLLQ